MKNRIQLSKPVMILIFFLGLGMSNLFGQTKEECLKVVDLTFSDLNAKKTSSILPYLSPKFSISGYSGDLGKTILEQMFIQINDEVTAYKLTSEKLADGKLTLIFESNFKKLGINQTTFIFDQQNKLLELILI